MDSLTVKLECLRLAASRIASKDPTEIVELAKAFESYVSEPSPTCSTSKDVQPSVTSGQKPNDTEKDQKSNQKWFKE